MYELDPSLISELAEKFRSSFQDGEIWLDRQRMIMIHVAAMGSLRKEMIETLGSERARGLLTRMGYAWPVN